MPVQGATPDVVGYQLQGEVTLCSGNSQNRPFGGAEYGL